MIIFTCLQCNKKFKTVEEAEKHYREHIKNDKSNELVESPLRRNKKDI